ncbi:MAG: hypothetical protein UHX00_08225, partial [Caryophanon sp.]|nr:hypothetical protein [Caryophanon sp.]
ALVAMAHNLRKWVGHRLHFSVQTEKSGFGKHFVFQIRFYFGLIGQPPAHFLKITKSGLVIHCEKISGWR